MTELRLHQCRLDNRYDLLEVLGRGSYAELYVARDDQAPEGDPHHLVVIKALNPYLQGDHDTELERTLLENFRNEAVALDRVRHPHIINRLGHGTAIDLAGRTFHYIVLEYMPGGDLAALCRRHPLALDETLFYLEQTCAGLGYAHSQGVIHRDVKPHNLLLTADRRIVKITDFGVAKIKLIAASEGAITRVGTDVYAAPEHHPLAQTGPLVTRPLAPSGHLTPAADVYSLAKTTYMLLTGEAPRRFAQRSITEFTSPVADESWAADVLAVLRRATQVNPAERTQTVQEFWLELSRASRYAGRPLSTSPSSDNAASSPLAHGDTRTQDARVQATAESVRSNNPGISSQPLSATPVDARPRIVVDIANPARDMVREPSAPPAVNLAAMSHAPADAAQQTPPRNSFLTRIRLWAVALLIVTLFAGMMYATYQYVRGSATNASQATPAAQPSQGAQAMVGREMMTTTDVNLRSGAGVTTRRVGLAERGSRVRVLNVRDDWYEVRIVERGRTPEDGSLADQGWINSTYLRQQ